METVTKSTDDFAQYLEMQIGKLLEHDFIAQQQSNFFKMRKENLRENEMLVVCDFSENYKFIIQGSIQSYHWTSKLCTIHPFVLYWKENGQSKSKSIVVIAESTEHDVTAVYLFQQKLIGKIEQMNLAIERIIFFSDGCGGQYKNYKNFYNVSQFEQDYGYASEWHFFATSHGKSPCDGVGGTFKRNARRESLQRRPDEDPLATAEELYKWAIGKDSSMEYIFCTEQEYKTTVLQEVGRYGRASTINGTLKLHSFKPLPNGQFEVKRYSQSEESEIVDLLH